ncbi:MAG: phosphoribosylamine--glycine ligase [Oscillospiraceae bacterium]|nr:phosphoribosylamine--glycine ligase [Oscillospiraceae bacterium]
MDILIVGGGGREHAIIRALKRSPRCGKLYCAPGNGGIAADAECFPVSAADIGGMVVLARELAVDLVFVAPDDPLVAGMADALETAGIAAFGPSKAAAAIEGSKVFSKGLMKQYGIPTAAYESFGDPEAALGYITGRGKFPVWIKADGLAFGKGAVFCADIAQAADTLRAMMTDRIFGESGTRVVVEEHMTGPEVSVLAFTDGTTVRPMVSAMDHKQVYNGGRGPNTGGMGTVSPNPHYTAVHADWCMAHIFQPTADAMRAEGRPFRGVLFFGLMLTPDGPKVIEFNCRFGDPEAQVVLPRLKTDLIDIIDAIRGERLAEAEITWSNDACACVVMASPGYPVSYPKGLPISGLDESGQAADPEITVYHAGTTKNDNGYITNGGRVLGVTAKAETLEQALDKAYTAVETIHFDGAHYRKDIGKIVISD